MLNSPITLALAAFAAVPLFVALVDRPRLGLYLTIFCSAVLISPELPIVREKLSAAELTMLLTWLALLTRIAIGRSRLRRVSVSANQKMSLLLGGLFVGWAMISFVVNQLGIETGEAFFASSIETLNYVYAYLMFCTVVYLVDDWNALQASLVAWFLGALLVSLVGALALSGGAPAWAYDEFTGRISSTLRTANQVPMYLMPIVIPLAFWTVKAGRGLHRRALTGLILIGAFATVVGSGSRTGFLMCLLSIVMIVALALLEAPRRGYRRGLMLSTGFGISICLGIYILGVLATYQGDYLLGRTPAWQRPVVMLYDWLAGYGELDRSRARQLELAWQFFREQPIFGIGPKLYSTLYRTDEIHNTYVAVLLEMGIVGAAFFGIWLLHLLRTGWRTGQRVRDPFQRLIVLALVAGMVLLLIYGMTMFGLRQRNLWLMAGLIVASRSLWRQVQAGSPKQNAAGLAGPDQRRVNSTVVGSYAAGSDYR